MTRYFKKYSLHYRSLLAMGVPIMVGQLGVILTGYDRRIIGRIFCQQHIHVAAHVRNGFCDGNHSAYRRTNRSKRIASGGTDFPLWTFCEWYTGSIAYSHHGNIVLFSRSHGIAARTVTADASLLFVAPHRSRSGFIVQCIQAIC